MLNVKDKVRRVAVLDFFAVKLQPQIQVVWIGNFIRRSHVRTKRSKGIGRLAFNPLTAFFDLPLTF